MSCCEGVQSCGSPCRVELEGHATCSQAQQPHWDVYCRRVMHVPVGFAPLPIIHNFEGKTCPHASPPNVHHVCGRCCRTRRLFELHPLASCRSLQCFNKPIIHTLCLSLRKMRHLHLLHLSGDRDMLQNSLNKGICRDPQQSAATGCACSGGTIQLQDPRLLWLYPVPEPQSHVSIHHPASMTSRPTCREGTPLVP